MIIGNDILEIKKIFEAGLFKPASSEQLRAREDDTARQEREEKEREAAEQVEYERKWREENAAKIQAKEAWVVRFSAISQKLGFTPEVKGLDNENDRWRLTDMSLEAKREDGALLNFYAGGYRSPVNKVNVSCSFSDVKRRGFTNDEHPGSINMSLSKTDDQIMQEIKRRLLPYVENAIKRTTTRLGEEDAAENGRNSLLNDAANILGLKVQTPYGRDQYPHISKYVNGQIESVEVKTDYHGRKATINLRVTKESMGGILQAIKAVIDAQKTEEEE